MSKSKDGQQHPKKIARDNKENCPQRPLLKSRMSWEGRSIPLLLENGAWRARKRSKGLTVDIGTGTPDLAAAKRFVKEEMERRATQPPAPKKVSLRMLAKVYLDTPKRASYKVAVDNVERLESLVKTAWGKTLEQVETKALPGLWAAYVAKRQKLSMPDYNTRRPVNAGINSAMRMARSMLIDNLHPAYAAAGIILPPDAANVMWAAELHAIRPDAEDEAMIANWHVLSDRSLWWAIGLARFAGLRRSEILAMRGKWAVQRGEGVVIELRDRPEDKYWTKTGRPYYSVVLEPHLAEALKSVPADLPIIAEPDAASWMERRPQQWLQPFVGKARLPLHRLRGLYADHVRRETEQAILTRREGTKAASLALGHSSTAVTEKSYLDPNAAPAQAPVTFGTKVASWTM